jgi:hypothetical protein
VTREEIIEACAEAAHDAWFVEKSHRLLEHKLPPSWPSETGEEQLVPWEMLSEPVREFDRIVVGAIIDAMEEKGVVTF